MISPMERREFLQASLAGAGLTLAFCIPGLGPVASAQAKQSESSEGCMPNAWLRITPDNIVTILVSRSEMGQGVFTSMPMIVVEELQADWKQVRVEASPTRPAYVDPVMKMQITGGSMSVRNMFDPLRQAGAAAREMLRQAAAAEWNVPVGECRAEKGTIKHTGSDRSLTFGELCKKASALPVPKAPPLKKYSDFKLVGTSVPRVDSVDKVNGKAVFGVDVIRPEMLYAVVARSPVFGGNVLSFDENAAKKVAGVREVLRISTGIAVCADTLYAAMNGRNELNAKWDKGTHPDLNNAALDKIFAEGLDMKGMATTKHGETGPALEKAAKKLDAVYTFPYVAHVPFEPINCTAHVQSDRCDIWCPTQSQTGALKTGARITGLKESQVYVHSMLLGGGFGRRGRNGGSGGSRRDCQSPAEAGAAFLDQGRGHQV